MAVAEKRAKRRQHRSTESPVERERERASNVSFCTVLMDSGANLTVGGSADHVALFFYFFSLSSPPPPPFFFFAKLRGNWPPATPTSLLPPRTRVTLPRAAEYCIGRLKGLRIGGGAGRGWRKKKGVHRACKRKREDDGSSAPFLPSLLRHLRPLEPRRLHHGSSLHITRRSNATPRRQ